MTSPTRQALPREVVSAAADWFARLQEEDASEHDFQQWQSWMSAAPEHECAYREIENAWHLIGKVDPPPWVSAQELAKDSRTDSVAAGPTNCRVAQQAHQAGQDPGLSPGIPVAQARRDAAISNRSLPWSLAATVLMVVALGVALQFAGDRSASDYSTATAEQRSIRLSDGSRVTIGAASRITPKFEDATRRITLDYGEAFFEVAHDPARPFVVVVSGIEVRAVGTAFNVRTSDDRVLISVAEGRVAVTPGKSSFAAPHENMENKNWNTVGGVEKSAPAAVLVSAGHELTLTPEGNPEQQERPASEIATWRDGRFEYRGEELRHVVEDLNRYADPPIVLSDDAAMLRYSGTVFPDQIDEWLEGVSGALPVAVHDSGGKRLITRVH